MATEVTHPKGHASNPMTDTDVEAKFSRMFKSYGNPVQCEAALEGLWNVDRFDDIGELLRLFQVAEGRATAIA
jgi:2-methylcitrate dehydratase